MKIKELIQRVESLYSQGVPSFDSRLKARQIYSKLISVRMLLLSQKSNKRQTLSSWNYQTLSGVEMVLAEKHEIPCAPPTGCKILRSKIKLPKIINSSFGYLISVTTLDGMISFSETSWEKYKYKKGSKYTAFKPDYFFRDGYLYITQRELLKYVSIEAVFEDPLAVIEFPTCDSTEKECYDPLDLDFPIEGTLVEGLISKAVEELIVFFRQGRADNMNDNVDNIVEDGK